MRFRTLALAASLFLAATPATTARAEPTASESETALQLYKDAKAMRDRGELEKALEKFRAAHALAETPITALELGRTFVMMGKLVEGREVLLAVQRIPVRKNESQKAVDARKESDSLAAAIKPRLATLNLTVKGSGKLSVDNVSVPAAAFSAPRLVNPGLHVIVSEVEGAAPKRQEITLTEGQTQEVVVDMAAEKGVARTDDKVVPPTNPPPPESHGRSPLVYVGFGVGIVGVGVGAVTGILTLSKAGNLKDACVSEKCPPSSQSDLDSAGTTGTISTIGFIVGAVGLTVGLVTLLLDKPAATSTNAAHVWITPVGAMGRF